MKRSYITKLLVLLLPVYFAVSCTPQRKLKYLQGEGEKKDTFQNIIQSYKIRTGDVLYVKILGLDEKSYSFFNTQEIGYGGYNNITVYLNSYSVSDSGFINLPVIGSVFVMGLTIEGVKVKIQEQLNKFIDKGNVMVHLGNFTFTVLGEVSKPGSFYMYDDKLTVFQAIGFAGDLTTYGNRQKVCVVRNCEGKITINYIDLNNKSILNSEFYYIYPNDIIYIEPLPAKSYGFATFPFVTILSGITTLILVLKFLMN